MRKTIAILCSLVMLFQCSIKTVIGVQFYLCQEYISQTLCENKANPELCCQGKCYLKKQLTKEENREQSIPNILKDKAETFFITNSDLSTVFYSHNSFISIATPYPADLCQGIHVRVFNPPQFFINPPFIA